MRGEDVSQVTEIDLACYPTMMPAPNYQAELTNPLAHYIVVVDNDPTTLSNRSPGPYIPGFAGIWLMAGEAHVINVAVRTKNRLEGLGELLFIGLIQQAQILMARLITLEVRVSNVAAQRLYVKYGLTERGRRRAYYNDNREDAIIMTLDDPSSIAYEVAFNTLRQEYAKKWLRDTALMIDS